MAHVPAGAAAPDAMELLDFFDGLGVFADLDSTTQENGAIVSTNRASAAHAEDSKESFVSLLMGYSLDGISTVLHEVESGSEAQTHEPMMESQLQFVRIHEADLDIIGSNSAGLNFANASSTVSPVGSGDYDSEPNSVVSELVADEAPSADKAKPAKRPKKKKKSTSQRQKEELAYLRGKVTELEIALNNIKGDSPKTERASEDGDGGDAARSASTGQRCAVSTTSMWQLAAKRQLEDKTRAELENARLREKMAGQIKFTKSLERMLRKRRIWDVMQDTLNPLRFMELSSRDSEIFEQLSNRVNARIPNLDHIFKARGLTMEVTAVNSSEIVGDDDEGMRIEFTNAATTPFDFHKVSDVVWKHLRMKHVTLPSIHMSTQVIEETDDLLVMKQSVTSTTYHDVNDTTVHVVLRRMTCDDRVLMLWESITSSNGSVLRGVPAVQVITKGCGKITDCGGEMDDGLASSLLQSYVYVVPTIVALATDSESEEDVNRPPSRINTIGVLTDMITSSYQQNAQTMRQFIENALFDDLVQGSKAEST
uniref:Uncharacterized protein n=1 Tax=Globisporangium ultimum (strain ATCC 200006 / CBS 805.95 / DAOM BR144) TaxID=431595 RepID=K3W9L4_GLOUD